MKILKNFTFIMTLLYLNALSARVVSADGRFQSIDDDGLPFIKKQLLSSAYQNAFNKELKSMGLDKTAFWTSFDQKFEEYFSPIELKLAQRYKVKDAEGNELSSVSGKRRVDYKKALRLKRYQKKRSFGKFDRIVTQYSIRKMSRSPKYPNSRYLRADVKVNRREVHRLYLKFTANNQGHRYHKLFLSTNFNLKSMSWLDTGVEVESDFTDVVRMHWKEKLESLLVDSVSEVILCDEDNLNQLKLLNAQLSKAKDAKNIKEKVADFSKFENTLWMNINVTLRKTDEEPIGQKRSFVVEEEMTLQDVISGRVISFLDMKTQETTYSSNDSKLLSSNVASLVYSGVMDSFNTSITHIAKKGGSLGHDSIHVDGRFNMSDLFSLRSLLEEKGIRFGLKPNISSFGNQEASIDLYYRGSRDDIMLLLGEMNGKKLTNGKTLKMSNLEKPTHFTVMP